MRIHLLHHYAGGRSAWSTSMLVNSCVTGLHGTYLKCHVIVAGCVIRFEHLVATLVALCMFHLISERTPRFLLCALLGSS